MFIIFITLVIISVIVLVAVFMKDIETGVFVTFILLMILAIPFYMTFRWQISEDYYTGYIYSRDSSFGYTKYHIRFSQNAGNDSQPSFTIKSGTDTEKTLDDLVGSNTKVKIKVPSAPPKFVNNIFEPASFAEIYETNL